MKTLASTVEPIGGQSKVLRLLAMLVGFAMLCFGLVSTGPAAQAIEFGTGIVRGTMSLPAGVDATKYRVQLELLDGSGGYGGGPLNVDGSFETAQVATGQYRAHLIQNSTGNGVPASTQYLELIGGGTTVSVTDGQVSTPKFVMKPMTSTIKGLADVVDYPRMVVMIDQLIDGQWVYLSHIYDGSGATGVNYTSPKLAAGTYNVRFYADPQVASPVQGAQQHVSLSWGQNFKDPWATRKQIVVAQGQAVTGIDMVIPRTWVSPTSPTISGTAKVGVELTGAHVAPSPQPDSIVYQWFQGAPNGELTNIDGATGLSYTPTAADEGKQLTLQARYFKAKYPDQYTFSAATAAVAPADLLNFTSTPAPTISGTAKVGSTITAVPGTWAPGATSYSYQWLKNDVAIPGATSVSLALKASDASATMSVRMTGAKAGYSSKTVTSAPINVAAGTFVSEALKISGTAQVGQPLTAVPGTWTPTATFTYQWVRGSNAIAGATGSKYTAVAADSGQQISVRVTGTSAGYTAKTVTSAATAAVSDGTFGASKPIISGIAQVGQEIKVAPGTWTPTATLSYQWLRGGSVIAGATGTTYNVTAADRGKTLSVKVTGKAAGYTPKDEISASTVAVVAGAFVTATPTISGTPQVGKTLSAAAGTWSPSASFTYQWMREGTAISGATGPTYRVAAADSGKKLSVKVSGSADGYASASATSSVTAAAAAGTMSSVKPTITGPPQVGKMLSAAAGTWSPSASFTYQWLREGAAISGATKSTYAVVAADNGQRLSVQVTGTATGYANKTETSAVTSAVAVGTFAPAVPTVAGKAVVGSTLTVTPGTWAPVADSYTYQWLRDGVVITGANQANFTLTDADLGKRVSVTVSGEKAVYLKASKTSAATATVMLAVYAPLPKTPFADVSTSDKFYAPISWMYTEGLSTGVKTATGREYQSKVGVSREAMAAFLYRLEGAKYTGPAKSPFVDVKKGDKFYNEIAWMHAEGLATGVNTGSGRAYQPKATVSREAMAAFIYRLEGAKVQAPGTSPFGDMKSSDKFYKEISWMSVAGLSTGIKQPSGKPFYDPKAQVSREAMAAFLYRLETQK